MAAPFSFLADADNDAADMLYKGPQRTDDEDDRSSKGVGQNFGPSGDGHSSGHSPMPGDAVASASTGSPAATTASLRGKPPQPAQQPVTGSDNPTEDALVAPKAPAMDYTAINAAMAKRTADSAAIDRNAPGIKPTWKDRLLGGVTGFLSRDMSLGADVTNRKFNQAYGQQQRNLAADEVGIQAANAPLQSQAQDFERQIQRFNAQDRAVGVNAKAQANEALAEKYKSAIDPRSVHQDKDGNWVGTTNDGRTVPTDEPRWSTNSPEARQTAELDARVKAAERIGLRPGTEDYKFYMANGKLKEPGQQTNIKLPSEQLEQYNDWKASFKQQNGRAPNADEINAYRRGAPEKPRVGTPGQFDAVAKQTAAAYALAKKQYDNGTLSAAELAQENQRIGAENSERTRGLGGIPGEDANQAAAPQAQQRPPAAPPAQRPAAAPQAQAIKTQRTNQQVKVNDVVTVQGKQYQVAGINPQTNKPILKPLAGR